jgi:hypothetical protein
MEEKDLKIGDKYLLKLTTIKRTWRWVDDAELVEIKEDKLIFVKRGTPWKYTINKEEFLSGERIKHRKFYDVNKLGDKSKFY